MSEENKSKESKLPLGIGLGVAIGTSIGVATDDIGLWLPLGIAFGVAIGTSLSAKGAKKEED